MLTMKDSPTQLIRAAASGQNEAWAQLFKRYQRRLYLFLHKACGNEADALDLLQSTFETMIRKIGKLQSHDKFESWMFGIAYRKALEHHKSKSRQPVTADYNDSTMPEPATPPQENPSAIYIKSEQQQRLTQILSDLPLHQRLTMELHYIEEKSCRQIADIMDCSEKTVWSRLYLAQQAIKETIIRSRNNRLL